jgi:gluconolactonase
VSANKLTPFLQPSGRANGMYFDAKGNLISCSDENTALWSITPDGKHTVIVQQFEGKPLNGPNDVWVRPQGGYYITDPFYARPWWNYEKRPQAGEHVYFVSTEGKIQRVVTDMQQPNGIIGTPDGKTLYVADIGASKTYAFDIQNDGTLTRKRLFCPAGSDGMTLDTEGNLYLSGRGVTVYDSSGKQVAHIAVPAGWTANVSFGGKDHRTLFMTAGESLYSIRTLHAGANPSK